MYHYS